jgi:hypothetical protein
MEGMQVPLGHLGVNVPDLARAKASYDRLMPALEYESFVAAADEFAYRPADGKRGTFIFFYEARGASEYSRDATVSSIWRSSCEAATTCARCTRW